VRDTGIGIAADQRARIFDMFAQVDTSVGRAASGLGIGLTLVKTFTELHGGTVEVNSAGPGQGSEFIVRLPTIGGSSISSGQSTAKKPSHSGTPTQEGAA
jgi:signal transduction histidine kinase